MEVLLARVGDSAKPNDDSLILQQITSQAMNHAIRTGITITSGFAIDQCARLLKTKHGQEHDELADLHRRLQDKIRIIAPAIDMIELIAARGNTSLESAVSLTKTIRLDIQDLGGRIADAAGQQDLSQPGNSKATSQAQSQLELQYIIKHMKQLLARIEDAVPLINLAITTSGVNLSTNLPASVSPSRLLQASMFLNAGDSQYGLMHSQVVQIGPTFTLSMYMMLFCGHGQKTQDEAGVRTTIWKEVIHKARVKLVRVPLDKYNDFPFLSQEPGSRPFPSTKFSNYRSPADGAAQNSASEFAYQLCIIEDLDDGRYHTFEYNTAPSHIDDVPSAGLCELIPIHEVSRIFYADTGKVLNIGSNDEPNNPVLLIKRDVNAIPPSGMMTRRNPEKVDSVLADGSQPSPLGSGEAELTAQLHRDMEGNHDGGQSTRSRSWHLPPNLDPEWVAFEVYRAESPDSDLEDADEEASVHHSSQPSIESTLTSALSALQFSTPPPDASQPDFRNSGSASSFTPNLEKRSPQTLPLVQIQTRLSLLEMLIRLTSLQQFQQASHLTITDELLNYFLEDASTTGAAPGDAEARKRIRMEARARVGFDPYDESPIKRRGEDYQNHDALHTEEHSLAEASVDPGFIHNSLPSQEYERGYDAALADINSAARQGRRSALASRENTPATPMSPLAFRGREQDSPFPLQSSTATRRPLLSEDIPLATSKESKTSSSQPQDSHRGKENQRESVGLANPLSTSPATASGLRKSLVPEERIRAEIESGRLKGLGSPLARSPDRG